MMTTIGNRHSRRAVGSVRTLRASSLRRARRRSLAEPASATATRRQRRPAVRRLPPLTRKSVRPLLRLVASNPDLPKGSAGKRERPHLMLVGAAPAGLIAPLPQPFDDREPRAHAMVVLGLAVAGLVALATSVGRLLAS